MNNSYYWTNKEQRSKQAQFHYEQMKRNYKQEIENSINNSCIYDDKYNFKNSLKNDSMNIIIDDIDSVNAIIKYSKYKIAILNFASYKHPGGMFLQGSKAQEECLCHKSTLYNVLKEFKDYYSWNELNKNKALYKNRAIYSKDILFINNNNIYKCDVITCAAPNKMVAQKYCKVSNEENSKILNERIKFVLDIANEQNVSTLILGAFGCGVFGQNPYEVASIFKNLLINYSFNKIIFAIPGGNNYIAFKEIFK